MHYEKSCQEPNLVANKSGFKITSVSASKFDGQTQQTRINRLLDRLFEIMILKLNVSGCPDSFIESYLTCQKLTPHLNESHK